MRSSRAWAMWLNDGHQHAEVGVVAGARAGCRAGRRRWPRRPGDTSASGRSVRRLAHQPRAAPASVVTTAAPSSAMASDSSVVLRLGRARRTRSTPLVAGGQRDADDQLGFAVELGCACGAACPARRPVAQRQRERVLPELGTTVSPRGVATGRVTRSTGVRAPTAVSELSRSLVSVLGAELRCARSSALRSAWRVADASRWFTGSRG